ncbi:MAG: PAS domain S-box protein [candidate division Zixibacteria bacterium]|nr:PAS domain S-box protein [candidate division Zixibacteria bacterium]
MAPQESKSVSNNISDLQRELAEAKAEIKRIKAEYDFLLRNMPELIITIDADGNILKLNRSVEDMPAEEFIGANIYNFIVEHHKDIVKGVIDRVQKSGTNAPFETLTVLKGKRIWWSNYIIPKSGDSGRETFIVVAENITERKFAEEALRESEWNYRQLYRKSLDGIVSTDMNGVFVDCNPAYSEMLGYTIDELRKMSFKEITPERWIEWENKKVIEEKIINRGYSDLYEKEYIRKDGTVFPVELSAYLISDIDGNPVGMWAFARDITKRKKLEESLHKSEREFRTLAENAPNIVARFDRDLRHIYVNPAIEKASGIPAEQFIGKTHEEIGLPEQNVKEWKSHLHKAFNDKLRQKNEIYYDTPEGRRYFESEVVPELTNDGEVNTVLSIIRDITERKETEKALLEREATLNSIFHVAPIGIGMIVSRTFKKVNDRFCQMVGYSRDELIGRNALMIYSSREEYDRVGKDKYDQIDKYGTGTIETQWKRKDGTIIDVLLSSTALDKHHLLSGVIFTALDITDRKRTLVALRESENRFRLMADNTTDIISRHDLDSTFLYVSPASENVLGYKPSELIGKRAYDYLHSEDKKWVLDIHGSVNGLLRFPTITYRFRKKEGDYIWLETTNKPIKRPGGAEVMEVISVSRDITDRKMAEEALEMEHKQLTSIFDSIDEVVYICDPENRELIFVNEAFRKQWGGLNPNKLCKDAVPITEKGCRSCEPGISKGSKEGVFNSIEWYNRENGKWYRTLGRKIRWPDGREVNYHMAIDITERKEAELREAELREKLIQSEKLAFIGKMAAGVAHEINNPLAVLSGMLQELLKRTDQESKQYQKFYRMRKVSDRIGKTIDGLLQFSRQTKIKVKPCNINEIVRESIALVKEKAAFENIELREDYGTEIPPVNLEKEQIIQVFVNLIRNALDSMRHGGELSVKTRYINKIKQVSVAISDTGEGISPEGVKKLFTPFYTTKEVGRGTGLGLAISYGIIESHRGRIDVESELGKGSTFTIYLPLETEVVESDGMLTFATKENGEADN